MFVIENNNYQSRRKVCEKNHVVQPYGAAFGRSFSHSVVDTAEGGIW